MSSLPAGWYKDPADPDTQRYWDGDGWVGKPLPADATPPDGPPPVEVEVAAEPPAPQPQPQPQPIPVPQLPTRPPPPAGWQPPPGMTAALPFPVQARPHGYALAGLDRRLAARLIDILAVLLLNVVVNGWFVYQWAQEFLPIYRAAEEAMRAQAGFDNLPTSSRIDSLSWVILIIATLLWLVYEAPAIGGSGQTLGKRIMRIKVVGVDDTKPLGFGRAFARWSRLGMWTPFWYCGIGFIAQAVYSLSPAFDPHLRQAFHDKTARTVVVAVPPGDRPLADATVGGSTDQSSKE